MTTIPGSCLCGRVAFEVSGRPLKFLYCHCRSCQKSTGSAHVSNLGYPLGALRWLRGEELIGEFTDTTDNVGFIRRFCRECGSVVPKQSRDKQLWVVPGGLLDGDPGVRPEANIFWAEHAPWYVSVDQIPTHDGRPV